jgi:hypothetical protein
MNTQRSQSPSEVRDDVKNEDASVNERAGSAALESTASQPATTARQFGPLWKSASASRASLRMCTEREPRAARMIS